MLNNIITEQLLLNDGPNSIEGSLKDFHQVTTSVTTFKAILEYCFNQNEFQKPD